MSPYLEIFTLHLVLQYPAKPGLEGWRLKGIVGLHLPKFTTFHSYSNSIFTSHCSSLAVSHHQQGFWNLSLVNHGRSQQKRRADSFHKGRKSKAPRVFRALLQDSSSAPPHLPASLPPSKIQDLWVQRTLRLDNGMADQPSMFLHFSWIVFSICSWLSLCKSTCSWLLRRILKKQV